MSEKEGRKHRRIGLLSSVGIHFALLLLFLFAIGWKAPDPPLSEYGSGVELNFGLDSEGGGDIQPVVPVGSEAVTPVKEETTEQQSTPVETTVPEEKVQPKTEPAKEESTLTGQEDSPVEVKETKKETKKIETPKEKVVEKKEVKKPVKNEEAKVKKPKEEVVATKKTEVEGTKKAAGGQSQGDDKGKTGDKGSPEGSLDPNGQYTGKPGVGGLGGGGGNGFALQMSGWSWDAAPQAPKLPDNENGRIVFEIEVDADGEIVRISTIERNLSPEAEKICKQEIQKRSLVRTSNTAAPPRSTGKITFVLKTQ